MTTEEIAARIRLAMRAFKAHPERWGRGAFINDRTGCMCIIGGAAALGMRKQRVQWRSIQEAAIRLRQEIRAVPGLSWQLMKANDVARNVPAMCRRVEAVLKAHGL